MAAPSAADMFDPVAYAKAMAAANGAASKASTTSTVAYQPTASNPNPGYSQAMTSANQAASQASVAAGAPVQPGGSSATAYTPPAPTSGGSPTSSDTSALLATPGAYEQWIKANAGTLNTPTNVENLYKSGSASALDSSPLSGLTSGSADAGYNAWLGGQAAPSAGRSASMTGGGNPGFSAGVLGSLSTTPSNATDVYGNVANPALKDAGAMEAFQAAYGNDPMQKGYTENLYESGMDHLNPFYDYAEQRAMQNARNSSAARGGFNTGLAAQQESDIGANIRGQQAQEQSALAPQADAAKVSRETLGANEANLAQSQEQARVNTLSQAAAAGDQADLGKSQVRVAAAGNADTSANQAYASSVTAAGNADRSAIDAFNAETGAHYNAGQLGLAQQGQNTTLASLQDQSKRNNLVTEYNLAGAADASAMGRFNTQAGLESDLQTTGQNRIQGGLNATSGLSSAESAIAQNVWNDMSQVNSLDATTLQALAEKYGVSLQEMQDLAGAFSKGASMAISAFAPGGK